MSKQRRWGAFVATILVVAACSEGGPRPRVDGGRDGAAPDLGLDAARDQAVVDGAGDGAGESLPDFPSLPEAGYDFPQSDAPLSNATVLYWVGKNRGEVGLREVAADGSGQPRPVAGFSGSLALDSLELAGQYARLPLRSDLPRVVDRGFPRVRLPDGSSIFYLHRSLLGTSALLKVSAQGSLDLLVEESGLYRDSIGPSIAFDESVTHAAFVAAKETVLYVAKLDGGTFGNGESTARVALPAEVSRVVGASLRLVSGRVFAVAELQSGDRALLSAPFAPSLGPASAQDVEGATALAFIGDDLLVGASGAALLFSAASDRSGNQHLYRLDLVGGSVARLTVQAKAMAEVGDVQRRRALSATHVAYLADEAGTLHLHVAAAEQEATATLVTSPRFFEISAAVVIERFVFESDAVLLFWAGVGANQLDLYRYDASADTLQNLTDPAATQPYSGLGNLAVRTLVHEAAGQGVYFIGEHYFEGFRNFFYYPFGGPGRQLSAGIRLTDLPADFAHCAADGAFYTLALPELGRSQLEVFGGSLVRDENLERLTSLAGAGPWSVADLQLQQACATLLFSAGPFPGDRRLWAMEVGSRRVWPVTPIPRALGPWPLITADASTVVYASGGATSAMTLKAARLIGGGEITLDPTAGEVEPVAVY